MMRTHSSVETKWCSGQVNPSRRQPNLRWIHMYCRAKSQGESQQANVRALTFACCDSPWLLARQYMWIHRKLGCRREGLTCPLHHFVSTDECVRIMAQTEPGTLAAFDEAHYFTPEIVRAWLDASQ